MPPIVLKIKGNESFLPFSNLDQEELSKTWRVCTKVKDSLENGSRLENLSWRLWFIQNVLVSSDVKSKTKFKKWSSSTTKKMEREKELQPTSNNIYNDSTTTSTFISPQLPKQQQQQQQIEQQQKSVLDYSLNEIKPVGTENFVLNQFTSDQQGDQMIELKDIFPFGMQDFMYTEPTTAPVVSDTQINSSSYAYDNTSSWPQSNITDSSTYYNNNVQQYPSYTPNINYGQQQQQDFLADPISGIHSLFADHLEFPSLTIPANTNDENMTHAQQLQQQQPSNLVVDFNNAAYVAAAAAATAAALTTLPNATLHNKLLATLPRQTLASAERLLSPVNTKRSSIIAQTQHQKKKMTESLPQSSLGAGGRIDIANTKKQKQQHYFSTFQLNTDNTPTTTHTKKYVQQPQQPQQQQQPQEYHRSNHSSGQNSPITEEKPPICSNCEATSTPLWRRSADDKVLCNACGLYLKLHNAPRPKHLKPSHGKSKEEGENGLDGEDKESSAQPHITCTNCGTGKTPLWRRDAAGKALCNACGLYFKLHNENRPLSMKTDVIKKRQRAETLLSSTDSSETTTDGNKKPRYYDQQSLYSTENNNNGNTLGYRQSSSSLPGTGILMMTPSTTGTSSPT